MVLVNTNFFFLYLITKLKIGNHKTTNYDSEHSRSVLLHTTANVLPYLKSSSIVLYQCDQQSGLSVTLTRKRKLFKTLMCQGIEKD